MRLRSFFGLLLAIGFAFLVAYHSNLNEALLAERFQLTSTRSVPLWAAILGAFLMGFLPVGVALVVDTLRHELAQRKERRREREQTSLQAAFRRAVDLEADGQLVPAALELETYLAGRPESFGGLLRYGAVLREVGREDEAIDVHRRAANLYPHSTAVLYELAADYVAKGEPEVAREIHARLVRDVPGAGLEVLRRRRAEAVGRRDWTEAMRLHEQIGQVLSSNGDARALARDAVLGRGLDYQRGVLALEQDRPGDAAEIFRRVLAHEPRFLPARIMLGEAELLAEREEAAIEAWRSGYSETGSPVFLQRIEDHFIEREEPLRAIETLRRVIAEADNDLLPRFYLGRLYSRLEMLDEAARTLGGLAERIRSSPTYHFLLGRIHERRGDHARAVESYVACLQQLELGSAEYRCGVCHTRYEDWQDFCDRCRSWNSVELDFEEERLSAGELGVQPVPVWGALEDSGEIPIAALPTAED
jgi:lipopolysaccharide biosynthesis regulator YciM